LTGTTASATSCIFDELVAIFRTGVSVSVAIDQLARISSLNTIIDYTIFHFRQNYAL